MPALGGMVGEGCSITLACAEGVVGSVDWADWGLPYAVGADPLDPAAYAPVAWHTNVNYWHWSSTGVLSLHM